MVRLYAASSARHASTLLWVEVRAAIRRRQRVGDISTTDADRLVNSLELQRLRVSSLDVTSDVLARAAILIDARQLRSLDALQLASAIETAKRGAVVVFVSADKYLIAAAQAEGLQVMNPETSEDQREFA